MFRRSMSVSRRNSMWTKPLRHRLAVQALEDRAVPASLVVLNSNDSGADSLRAIVATANSNNEADTITFNAGVTAVNLTTGQIAISENFNLTINGAGVTINGDNVTATATNRIFNINVAAGNPTVTMNGLTLSNGNLTTGNNGGAILINNDPLVLNSVTFSNNKTAGGGGAIATTSAVSANLNVTNSFFTNNFATGVAGGIFCLGATTVTISGTTVSNNTASTNTGGFLQNNGTSSSITINSSSFTGNMSAAGASGAGVFQSGGASTVWSFSNNTFTSNTAVGGGSGVMNGGGSSTTFNFTNCSFINNTAGNGPGGALRFTGGSTTVSINACTISGNVANSTGSTGSGGAIDFYPLSGIGSLSITNSTISGNSAQGNGGAINLRTSGTGATVMTNCTITGNVVTLGAGDGGGVMFAAAPSVSTNGTLTINNCTITGNSAGPVSGAGGGIRRLLAINSGTLTVNSSIVAGNSATSGPDISSSSTIPFNIGGGHNVVGVADAGGFTLSGANRTGTTATPLDAKVNPLASNGGPTQTQSLQATSPGLNFGTNGLSLAFDARGTGFPRVNGSVPDVGAFESVTVNPEAKATLPVVTPAGATYTATVVYTDETGINTSMIDVNDVVLTGPGFVGNASPTMASFTGGGTSVTATYTFAAPGGTWDWTDNGLYTLIMQSTQVSDTDGPNDVIAGVLEVLPVAVTLPNPLVVDNAGDTDDSNFAANQLTLREAVRLSNFTTGQTDSITFAAGLTGQTISIGSLIFITDAVSITGLGAANLTLSGGNTTQLFGIALANGSGTVSLNQLTIANGNATAGMGGAIAVDTGNLTMTNVTLDSNKSTPSTLAGGGAILFNPAAKLTFNNCTITNNAAMGSASAALGGGGVVSANTAASTVTFNSCLISNNTSGLDNGGVIRGSTTGLNLVINDSTITTNSANLGGVGYMSLGSVVTVARSTLTGNTATSSLAAAGGGVFNFFTASGGTFSADSCLFANNSGGVGGAVAYSAGVFTFTNCTLDGNTATGNGGGAIFAGGGTTTLNNCTISGNVATTGNGGGIKKNAAAGTIAMNSTIVAANISATGGADINCPTGAATAITGGNNLVGIADVGNFTLAGSNKTGTIASPLDPMLSPLANNGGPTQTRALIAGSQAFNSGSNPTSALYDQRGIGFSRHLQTSVDIGAFEGINPVPAYSGTLANVPPINATYKASVTYTSPVGINTGSIDVGDVRFTGPGYAVPEAPVSATVTAGTNGAKSVTVEYVFTPPGGAWDFTDDGTYTLSVQGSQVFDTNAVPLAAVAGPVNSMLVAIPLPVLVVDNIDDVDDADYSAGKFTLREAINRANAAIGTADTITFAPSLNGQTISLNSLTSLDITDPLTITGPGAANLTVSGAMATRVFFANIPTIGSAITISGLTIADGNKTGGSGLWITNENATVSDCVFSNHFNSAAGGAIYVQQTAGTLTVNNSTFDLNSSGGGGAITIQASSGLFVNNCLFTNNTTFSNNSGGAIRYIATGGVTNAIIRNSTFFGNQTKFHGGAISFSTINGTALIQNCTIVNNVADYDDSGDGQGGGISIVAGGANAKVILDSCIVSGNVRGIGAPVADDLQNTSGGQFVGNFSLIGDATNATSFAPDAKTLALMGQNSMLNALANNGGPTQTMSLQAGSPALNNGSNPAGLTNDQRGVGFFRFAGPAADIGAFEVQAPAAKITAVQINDGSPQRSMITSLKVTFDQAVALPANPADAFMLSRNSDSAAVTLSASVLGNDVTLTFAGGAVDGKSLADGRYTLTALASQISFGNFDGDGNGTAGDNYVLASAANPNPPTNVFRLFGDADGDGTVAANDFIQFRLALGGNSTVFDFDNDGAVAASDFIQFRLRFGGSV